MPQSRRGRAVAAAVDAQSSSEDTSDVDARSKQSKTGPKKSDKKATAAALEELEPLNHEAVSISKNPEPTKAAPPEPAPALQQETVKSHVTLMPHQNG